MCSLANDAIRQAQNDAENNKLITLHLLPEGQVQSRVSSVVESLRASASIEITSYVDYVRTTIRANYLVSALNTNVVIGIDIIDDQFTVRGFETLYKESGLSPYWEGCGGDSRTTAATFHTLLNDSMYGDRIEWHERADFIYVKGFFLGCIPIDALLRGTLECLSEIECLKLLVEHFPSLSTVSMMR